MYAIPEIENLRAAEIQSAALHIGQIVAEQIARLENEFKRLAMTADMSAPALIAEPRRNHIKGTEHPATVGEMLAESLDFARGPTTDEVLGVLVLAASGRDAQPVAVELINRMASKWAEFQMEE